MKTLTIDRLRELFDRQEGGAFIRRSDARPMLGDHVGAGGRYRRLMIDGRAYYVHRLVWMWHHGDFPDGEVDHIDRDPSNNSIENLRVVTRSQNQQNQDGPKAGTLIGVRGVTLDRFTGRFKAQIQLGGKNFHLGRFDTVDEASSAYRRARSGLHTHSPAA